MAMLYPDSGLAIDPATQSCELEACLELGRLDGSVAMCPPSVRQLLALRSLRNLLVSALAGEGHEFTEHRFHAWFAGLATLSDEPALGKRDPRAICETILTEFGHSSWQELADIAPRFKRALLAPVALWGVGGSSDTDHMDIRTIVDGAHGLVNQLPPSPHPLADLRELHVSLGESLLFAPAEPHYQTVMLGPRSVTVEWHAPPSPRWAVEMVWGERWQRSGNLSVALPFPGLIRADAVNTIGSIDPSDRCAARGMIAMALRDVTHRLRQNIVDAGAACERIKALQAGRRASSRAPALIELLDGFGPLRSSQIEILLDATRLGVRAILSGLLDSGIVARTKLSGVWLFGTTLPTHQLYPVSCDASGGFAFSPAAIGEYDASMADIDRLLARYERGAADTD